MMSRLLLLGTPKVEESGQLSSVSLNNPTSLLIHLAYRRDWVSRSELAFLYRPDEDEVSALKQVRLLLYRAKQYSWAKDLETEKKQARFLISTDVHAFKEALLRQAWREATELYGGAFLADQSLAALPTYGAWLDIERSDLENHYQDALSMYARKLEGQGNYGEAANVLKKLLDLDRFAEDALQAYLRNTYLAGHRDKALKAYAAFCKDLSSEYSAEPLAATQDLAHTIREHRALEGFPLSPQTLAGTTSVSGRLPEQSTRFIGRQADLRGTMQQLRNSDCRLLTLAGLGGTGKTRLALELARLEQGRFKGGAYFVPLASLNSADALTTVLAQTLGLTLRAEPAPLEQVISYIRDKDILLILDNFEQLLEAAPTLSHLLAGAAGLKILVTSRESLRLNAEWLYDLGGLEYPHKNAEAAEAYDAVQLFISSAKRVAPKVTFDLGELSIVAQICRQVEGLPLAIELAASWARIMPVSRIAQELRQGYDLLQTDHTDLPERHRNLKAILSKTWQSLSEKKRVALTHFSVFQGGCTLEAAEKVTGTHVSVLLSLVNESLLKRVLPGRFEMHELIKQHAYQSLETQAGQFESALKKHAAYYQHELAKAQLNANKASKAKLNAVTEDLENFTAAWRYLAQYQELEQLDKLNEAMYTYYFTTGRFKEGLELFRSSTDLLQDTATPVLAKLKISEGRFWHRQGDLLNAKNTLKSALVIAEARQDKPVEAAAHSYLGDCFYEAGDYAEAQNHYEAAQTCFQTIADKPGLARIYNMLGNLAKSKVDLDIAKGYFTKSLVAFSELGNATGRANALNNIANLAEAQGDYAAAKASYLDCLTIFEDLNFVRGIAVIKNNLAVVELRLGKLAEAETFVRESLELKRVIADAISIVLSQVTLVDILLAKKDVAGAKSYAVSAFSTAIEKDFRRILSKTAPTLVKLCYDTGAYEEAEKLMKVLLKRTPSLKEELKPYQAKPASPEQGETSFEVIRIVNEVTAILSREDSA